MTRRETDALADEILARILPLDLDRQKAVMDRIAAAVILDRANRMYPPPPIRPPLPDDPRPAAVISPEEAAARVLDTERWGECCYGEDCDYDETRPHVHTPPWDGTHWTVVFDRETGRRFDWARA